jgi:hypothetical protein
MTLADFGYPVYALWFSCSQRLLIKSFGFQVFRVYLVKVYSRNVLCTLNLISTYFLYNKTCYWSGESKSSWLYFNHIHVHMLLNWRIKIFMVVLYTCTISSNINAWLHSKVCTLVHPLIRQTLSAMKKCPF